jgi:hypothetical protein
VLYCVVLLLLLLLLQIYFKFFGFPLSKERHFRKDRRVQKKVLSLKTPL